MAASNEDDESVLDLAEQTQRPLDIALHQQRIEAWHPILDPVWTIVAFLALGAILVPTGLKMSQLSDDVVELKRTYDAYDNPDPHCGIGTVYNDGKNCNITFEVDRDMEPPIFVHYEIENFHQNHRAYYRSRDPEQLLGSVGSQTAIYATQCEPLNFLGSGASRIQLNPCGLIANTFFNDVFKLVEGNSSDGNRPLVMIEEGIAWESDRRYLFKQPNGFKYEECPAGQCDKSCCAGDAWSCDKPYIEGNKCYRFYYPNDNTTQYLYETYEGVISPLLGVTDEHFIVWMRVATLPTFRKLYGYINQPIAAGTSLTFSVRANFAVKPFDGRKSLVVSTNNIFGGKNAILGQTFSGVGYFCLAVGILFALKHLIRPRKIADKKYLHYKQD